MAIDAATAKALKLQPGSWYNSGDKFYKYGEDRAYSMDEYKDITQPGWRTAPKPSGISSFTGALGSTGKSASGVVTNDMTYYVNGKTVDKGAYDSYLTTNPTTKPTLGDIAKQLAAATGTVTMNKPATQAPSVMTEKLPAPKYLAPKPATEAQTTATAPGTTPPAAFGGTAGTASGGVSITPRPISPEVQQVLDMLRTKISAAPVTAQDIMNSPDYQAQAKAINDMAALNAGQTTASIRRQLASRNMLRSTPAIQALTSAEGDIANKAAADKAALIPSMLANAYNRSQQDLQNYSSLLNTVAGLDNTSFNQGVSEFQTTAPYNQLTKGQQVQADQWQAQQNYQQGRDTLTDAYNRAEITGVFYDPAAVQLGQRIVQDKLANPDGKNAAAKTDADEARAQLSAMGYNADELFGSNVTADQAKANLTKLGIQTPQAKAAALQNEATQLQIDNAKYQAIIDQDPASGLAAQAKAKMAENDARIAQINAETASAYALANQRAQADTTTESAAQKAAREQAQKDQDALVGSYTSQFNITRPASLVWVQLQDLWAPDETGYVPTYKERQQDVNDALAQVPGLTSLDRGWLLLMLQSTALNDKSAQDNLNKPPYRKTDITGE